MKLRAVFTEKSMSNAARGSYTFFVDRRLTKHQIKRLVSDTFDVHVQSVRTMNVAGERKKTAKGKYRVVKTLKKAIVTLQEKEKIGLFEEKKKK